MTVTKEELIEKYGACSDGGLHSFNYVFGDHIRACISCGQMVDTETGELVVNPYEK